MVLWARSAVRSVLAPALRMPKKAAAAAKNEKAGSTASMVLETSKPGDPITINYLKNGKGAYAPSDIALSGDTVLSPGRTGAARGSAQ